MYPQTQGWQTGKALGKLLQQIQSGNQSPAVDCSSQTPLRSRFRTDEQKYRGARSQEWLCWRCQATNHCSADGLLSEKCRQAVTNIRLHPLSCFFHFLSSSLSYFRSVTWDHINYHVALHSACLRSSLQWLLTSYCGLNVIQRRCRNEKVVTSYPAGRSCPRVLCAARDLHCAIFQSCPKFRRKIFPFDWGRIDTDEWLSACAWWASDCQ